jgi:hypothetical protein
MDCANVEHVLELGYTLVVDIDSIVDNWTISLALQGKLESLQTAILRAQNIIEATLHNCTEANRVSRCKELYMLTSWLERNQVSCTLPISPQLGPARVHSQCLCL